MTYRRYRRETASSGKVCPTCKVNTLTSYEARKGYQCGSCTARDEAQF